MIARMEDRSSTLPPVDLPPAPHGKRLWVYDCEVFPNAFLAIFSDGREWRTFTDAESATVTTPYSSSSSGSSISVSA